mmetsp:Transcript_28287/g.51058  ORF Transcript_28287/g.51058 Transcript_28287/m.51058 type:complete len:113 (+) Transcript_28287:375-713(+)
MLPHPLFAGQAEGLMKTGKMKTLSFQFGWCNMQEDQLVHNAKAVIAKVKAVVEFRQVREIRVRDMDGLALPIWEAAMAKQRQRAVPQPRALGVMAPPMPPAAKRIKLEPLPD